MVSESIIFPRFAVSFVPAEPCEHIINVSFNKMAVPGCPILVNISGGMSGPQVSLGGPGPVHLPNSLVINHAGGRLEDIEVNVEGMQPEALIINWSVCLISSFYLCFSPHNSYLHRLCVFRSVFSPICRSPKTLVLDFHPSSPGLQPGHHPGCRTGSVLSSPPQKNATDSEGHLIVLLHRITTDFHAFVLQYA